MAHLNDIIKDHQKEAKERIASCYADAKKAPAKLIIKSEFEEQYPSSLYEIYSAQSLNKFREELQKGENGDEQFTAATKDLKGFVVQSGKNQAILFVRKKVAGEK